MDFALINDDIKIINGVPETDGGFETAVELSLFTDRRDDSGEEKRGWWGDALEDYPLGSRLWTLGREKMTADITDKASEYCREALQWMVDDGITTDAGLIIDTERNGLYAVKISISITKPDGTTSSYKYEYNWAQQKADPVHAR